MITDRYSIIYFTNFCCENFMFDHAYDVCILLLKIKLKNQKEMADRIGTMRVSLRSQLEEGQQDRSWDHITKQIGMFAFSGLTKQEVTALREKHSIYCV